MKVLTAALAALLLVALCFSADASPIGLSIATSSSMKGTEPNGCCFKYASHRIPQTLVTSAYVTSSMCSQPGVVLVTKKGRNICVDPQAPWVQEYLKNLEILPPAPAAQLSA